MKISTYIYCTLAYISICSDDIKLKTFSDKLISHLLRKNLEK